MELKPTASLWGIDCDLGDVADQLSSAFPFVQVPDEPFAVFATKGISWNLHPLTAVIRLDSEQLARERGTRLDTDLPVAVRAGEVVGIIGPRLCADMHTLSVHPGNHAIEWTKVQDGFLVAPMPLSHW